ncbi:MAG: RHS repeat-associated core domain-containing protein [Lysobacteraceae bacterium]
MGALFSQRVATRSSMWRRWVCLARYEANGNVAAIGDANGVVTKTTYNAIGQRTAVADPNQGSWGFAYNALGEVLAQSDARGIATTLSYDKLGRPVWRTATLDATGDGVADTVNDSWTYDPANAKGAPAANSRAINGMTERWTGTTYDSLARPVQTDAVQALASGTQQYKQRTKYDSYYGRPVGQEYPNGEAVQVLYSVYGHALAEKDPGTGIEYRRSNSVNARGQATQETFGNGVILTPTFQLQTGQLTGLTYSTASGNLRTLGYGYDVFGNLKRQSLNGGASREDYSYDQLHRLVQSIRSGAASGTVNYGFDAVGNLTKKSDFSSNTANAYSYTGGSCGGGANAVKSVALAAGGTRTYCYDANGNLTGDNAGLVLKYDHQNLPTVAQRGALRDDFRYGPDGQRTRSWGSDGNRVYLPGYEHRTDTGETKVYIGDYAVISRIGATRKVEYLLKDRLGSVDAVANASGAVIETRGYDAFGKPRNGTWNDLTPAKIQSTAVTPKGFTQHEHMNQLELIHMNGRAYDYNLGRFTGVDPFIQFPLNSQSLNPYSYILNNPLSRTDPTGYSCTPMTGSHVCGADTGATNGQSTAAKTETIGGIKLTTTKTVYANNGSVTNTTGRVANGASGGQSSCGADTRNGESTTPEKKGSGVPDLEPLTVTGLKNGTYDSGSWRSWYDFAGKFRDWFGGLKGLHMDAAYGSYAAGRDALPRHYEKAGWAIVGVMSVALPLPELEAGAMFSGSVGVRGASPGISFTAEELLIIREAQGIFGSAEMNAIYAAYKSGVPYEAVINGRLVLYEPGMANSGLTLFGENAFVIGRHAFSIPGELKKPFCTSFTD